MGYAMRLGLVVSLAVAFSESVVLGDVAGEYDALFGVEAKKVATSRAGADDAVFAVKLLKAAKEMSDSPELQMLLYEKACQFGSVVPAGCDTAMEALGLLEKSAPEKKDQWRQRKFEIVQLRFNKSYGAARKTAGQPYMEMLEALADAKVFAGNGAEAKKLYSRAYMVAKYIKSPNSAVIIAKNKRATAVIARQSKVKSLQSKLAANPKDTAVRKELIGLYIVELDKPAEAVKLLTDDLDEVTRTYVPLAAKKIDGLDEAICIELGDWYYRTLSKNASSTGKSVILARAQAYYQRFLDLHRKKDSQSYRAKAILESIDKKLARSGKTLTLTLGKGVAMKFIRIPAGVFMMGAPGDRQRKITISKAFYIGVTEVTQAQYASIAGKNPSKFRGPKNPVENTSWFDATAFCEAMSKKTRRAVRLPTEAQWEYACRAGKKTRFSFGDDEKAFDAYGWCKSNSAQKPHPVGQKRPNAWGLYDMHGNAREWCRDRYDEKYFANAKDVDPETTRETRKRVFRGGSWKDQARGCRSTGRQAIPIDYSRDYYRGGFRVVIVSDSGAKR